MIEYDNIAAFKAQLEAAVISKKEARRAFGVSDAVESQNYDPMRMGLVIDGVFISEESIITGEVLKGEIVNESPT